MGSPAPRGSSNRDSSRGSPRRAAYRVALTERATIVDRGEQLELWFVRVNDAWTRVTEHASATTEANSADEPDTAAGSERCPSGTIWIRTTELMLEAGTRVLLRQSWPRPRRLSVMSYLKQGLAVTQRVVRERHFVVSGNYRLAPVGRMLVKTEANKDAGSDQDDPKSLRDSA